MDTFATLDGDGIVTRYKHNGYLLMMDLRSIGLLPTEPPCCPRWSTAMLVRPARPFIWRCPSHDCRAEVSMLGNACLFGGCKKPYSCFQALFLWANQYFLKQIKTITHLSYPTLRKLLTAGGRVSYTRLLYDGGRRDLHRETEVQLGETTTC